MSREKGTFGYSANLEVNKAAPLDARRKVKSLNDLTNPNTWQGTFTYEGLDVYVEDVKSFYVLTGSDPTTEDNWVVQVANIIPIEAEDDFAKIGSNCIAEVKDDIILTKTVRLDNLNNVTITGKNIVVNDGIHGLLFNNCSNLTISVRQIITNRSSTEEVGDYDMSSWGVVLHNCRNVTLNQITFGGLRGGGLYSISSVFVDVKFCSFNKCNVGFASFLSGNQEVHNCNFECFMALCLNQGNVNSVHDNIFLTHTSFPSIQNIRAIGIELGASFFIANKKFTQSPVNYYNNIHYNKTGATTEQVQTIFANTKMPRQYGLSSSTYNFKGLTDLLLRPQVYLHYCTQCIVTNNSFDMPSDFNLRMFPRQNFYSICTGNVLTRGQIVKYQGSERFIYKDMNYIGYNNLPQADVNNGLTARIEELERQVEELVKNS